MVDPAVLSQPTKSESMNNLSKKARCLMRRRIWLHHVVCITKANLKQSIAGDISMVGEIMKPSNQER
jgi:hypothetical protein